MKDPHPPPPGGIIEPNFDVIERAVDRFTFPISKRDMLEQIPHEETLLLDGRNVELHQVVRDLRDDFFDTADEFRDALEHEYAGGPWAR